MNPSEPRRDISETQLGKLVRKNQEVVNEQLESVGQGYAFPVAEKVRKMEDEKIATGTEGKELSKQELFKVALGAIKAAWEQEIKPRLDEVRTAKVDHLKSGVDFFTPADMGSEKVIKQHFLDAFGSELIRIFGEEANKYLGNVESKIGIRIDPIDGTESFKFSKDKGWGIMVGVYVGEPSNEREVMSAIYLPEREILMYYIEGVGVFTTTLGESPLADAENVGSKEYNPISGRDDISDMIVTHWEHSDYKQRGNIKQIEDQLAQIKARIRSTDSVCEDVLEALQSNGKRAMIIDGDYSQVDFIPLSILGKLGYRIYDWYGNEQNFDDINLSNKKLVVVPPGKAGETILKTIKSVESLA